MHMASGAHSGTQLRTTHAGSDLTTEAHRARALNLRELSVSVVRWSLPFALGRNRCRLQRLADCDRAAGRMRLRARLTSVCALTAHVGVISDRSVDSRKQFAGEL